MTWQACPGFPRREFQSHPTVPLVRLYDFIDKYIDRSDFVFCQMDTDSAYIAFSAEKFEDLIKPEQKKIIY